MTSLLSNQFLRFYNSFNIKYEQSKSAVAAAILTCLAAVLAAKSSLDSNAVLSSSGCFTAVIIGIVAISLVINEQCLK